MNLIIATHNNGKFDEFCDILKDKFDKIYSLYDINITEEIEEDGQTLQENALIKARAVAKYVDDNTAVLADDTGLMVDCLDGKPGIHSARYASVTATLKQNRDFLLANMSDANDRRAHFECCLVLLLPNGKQLIAVGKTYGKILEKETGERGFGYDSLFFSDELGKSFAEGTLADKDRVSHRAKAIKILLEQLAQTNI